MLPNICSRIMARSPCLSFELELAESVTLLREPGLFGLTEPFCELFPLGVQRASGALIARKRDIEKLGV